MFTNYTYYTNNKDIVVALSTYAGKNVRGIAKCDPRDEFDELFANYVKQAEAEAKQASNKKSFQKNYEEVKYTGLEKGVPSVIRAVGAPLDTNYDNTTARTVTITRIVGDDGKRFRVVRPSFTQDPNYILNKIIYYIY